MEASTKDFIIYYEQEEGIGQLLDTLTQNMERILRFFRLKHLKEKVEIILYSTVEAYARLIIHEFVHICQQEVNSNCYGCEWFWEALATNLSGQKMDYPQKLCSKEELMFHYQELPNAYSISYHIGQYMLQNLPEEKIYEYVVNPSVLWEDTEKLLGVLE